MPLVIPQESCSNPVVLKNLSTYIVETGDPVQVQITIFGCTGEGINQAPFDGVILLDKSGSMAENDPDDVRITEAIFFSDYVADETRLAIVTFDGIAHEEIGLTADEDDRRDELNEEYGNVGGGTNLYAGIEKAHEILRNADPDRKKFVIMFTDGIGPCDPEANYEALADEALDLGISYYFIILVSEDLDGTVTEYADLTGGLFFYIDDVEEIHECYERIAEDASFYYHRSNIWLHEKIGPDVTIVPGSTFTTIEDVTQVQIDEFEVTGEISAFVGTLRENEDKTFVFDVVSTIPGPYDEEETVIVTADYPSSIVTYTWDDPDVEIIEEIPPKEFYSTRPPVLKVRKEYDKETSILTITLENSFSMDFEEMIMTDIRLIEIPTQYFQPDSDSAQPPLNFTFPSRIDDAIVWLVDEIRPTEIKTFQINLEPLVVEDWYNPPISVNALPYLGELLCAGINENPQVIEPTGDYGSDPYRAPLNTGYTGRVFYNLPDGSLAVAWLPEIESEVNDVEDIVGRVNRWVTPAYTFYEWLNPSEHRWQNRNPSEILYLNDSEDIWLDSSQQNGYWNISSNNEDAIKGANGTIVVQGQGDLFDRYSNNRIFVKVTQGMRGPDDPQSDYAPGEIWSEPTSNGGNLYFFNRNTDDWDFIASSDVPSVQIEGNDLMVFEVQDETIGSDYLMGYRIPKEEVIPLIRYFDFSLSMEIESYLMEHPNLWESAGENGFVSPGDVHRIMRDYEWWEFIHPENWFEASLKERFGDFLENRLISWGKESVKVKVEILPESSEKHTNNNYATETFLTGAGEFNIDPILEGEPQIIPPLPSWSFPASLITILVISIVIYWKRKTIRGFLKF